MAEIAGTNMIISVRGTNGSGKSTIVRNIKDRYPNIKEFWLRNKLPNRRKPTGYFCLNDYRYLFIPGHYEIANGGIDTLRDLPLVYELMLYMHSLGCDVLYEGDNIADRIDRILWMQHLKLDIRVIFIDHSLERCIKAVQKRGHNIKTKTIESIYNKCLNQYGQCVAAGVNCSRLSRTKTQQLIQSWLQI